MKEKDNYFATRMEFNSARGKVWKEIGAYLQQYISPDAVVLELGAGYCDFINNITAREKHAIDVFTDLPKYASASVKSHVCSVEELTKFQSQSMDVIFASNFFEHLDLQEAQQTLQNCFRILKKSGRIIILQPNFKYCYREYFDDYTHKTIYTHISLSDLLKSKGFDIERCTERFLPYSMKSKIPKVSFLVRLYLHSPFKPFAKQMLVIGKKTTDTTP